MEKGIKFFKPKIKQKVRNNLINGWKLSVQKTLL